MGLRDIESKLPPGFRFYPSDEELVCHYLYKKTRKERAWEGTLVEVDLHTCEPWELPEVAKLSANEWYFFSFRDRKYSTGSRTNRATITGYWKATGKDRSVHDPTTNSIVGMRKTLVFYRGRAPNGIKTSWVMHEFRLETPHMPPMEDWVLCRVFSKRSDQERWSASELGNNNDGHGNHTSSSSSSSSSLFDLQAMSIIPTTGCFSDQLPPFNVDLPTQEENNSFVNLRRLHCNFLEETEYISSVTGFINGSTRNEEDHGLLLGMGLGDHRHYGSGIDNICWETNLVEDMNTC